MFLDYVGRASSLLKTRLPQMDVSFPNLTFDFVALEILPKRSATSFQKMLWLACLNALLLEVRACLQVTRSVLSLARVSVLFPDVVSLAGDLEEGVAGGELMICMDFHLLFLIF